MELFHKRNSLITAPDIRFGDNFNQRNAAAVEIYPALVSRRMQQFSRIFLKMHAANSNTF